MSGTNGRQGLEAAPTLTSSDMERLEKCEITAESICAVLFRLMMEAKVTLRRRRAVTQADIARAVRAYRSEGLTARTRLMPDGSAEIEPIVYGDSDPDVFESHVPRREIDL